MTLHLRDTIFLQWSRTPEIGLAALEDTIASLGIPLLLRALSASSSEVATIARWRHGAATLDIAPSDTIQLVMNLSDVRNVRNRAGGFRADRVRGGSISVFSPDEGTRISVGGDADVLQIFMKQSYAEAVLESHLAGPSMFAFRDDRMQAIVMQILVGSARLGPDDALMVEEGLHWLARRIDGHATRLRVQQRMPVVPERGGLAPAALRRVEDLISVALEEVSSPSLFDMASAAGLSVTHFVRAFRYEKGLAPHKYLVRRRMERAISLLRSPHVPVAEVADEAGFSTPAHFVATFRSAMGVTPGAVREALAK
jgi:AraC family transcriptional regulator